MVHRMYIRNPRAIDLNPSQIAKHIDCDAGSREKPNTEPVISMQHPMNQNEYVRISYFRGILLWS